MLNPETFIKTLQKSNVNFYAGVPDSVLKGLCAYITEQIDEKNHFITSNEGAAIGLAIGHYIGTGNIPLVYMQNSGLGNAINPLLSLANNEVYSIPMLLVIGWRGEPGVKDEPQHVYQGKVTLDLLNDIGIPTIILSDEPKNATGQIIALLEQAESSNGPVAMLVRSGVFNSNTPSNAHSNFELTREQAIICAATLIEGDAVVVSTTGMASRELFEFRENSKLGHGQDFLTVGGMGHASQIALGIAVSQPDRHVYCFDGDGAVLMHMGSLAINGTSGCKNFTHFVLNNGCHASVGGQPTVGYDIDLSAVATACGYNNVYKAYTKDEIEHAMDASGKSGGPSFIEVMVSPGNRKDIGRPTTSPLENKRNLMKFLGVT
jgi:phosphonopyruvate decarboxylase